MDIKRKKKEKRIRLIGGLIGICVAVVSLFYFFHAEKAEAEKRMVEIVNYVKVQCSTYTHYNESSESKSLLRAIESARQMSTNINMETENGGQLSRELLKGNLQTLWVDGIIVLDKEGKTDCEYSTDMIHVIHYNTFLGIISQRIRSHGTFLESIFINAVL